MTCNLAHGVSARCLTRGPGDTGRLGVKSRGVLDIAQGRTGIGRCNRSIGTLRGFDSRYPHTAVGGCVGTILNAGHRRRRSVPHPGR